MSLFTSNSKIGWKDYWRSLLYVAVGVSLVLYVIIILVDPFDSIWFSPPLDRAPMATNQRFSYPTLAKNEVFDSAVIGSSSIRLFRPEVLNTYFNTRFVNLAINAARPYEQYKIFDLFVRHHPNPKNIIIGLDIKNDDMWCKTDIDEKHTHRAFPEWMYDKNPYNELLYHFNAKALEITGRQVAYLLGVAEERYQQDGYKNFTPPISEYDVQKVRQNIYGNKQPKQKAKAFLTPQMTKQQQRDLVFPALKYLDKMLKQLPAKTTKALLFIPRHYYVHPIKNSTDALVLEECKRRIINMISNHQNIFLFDAMIRSPITTKDSHYWDDIHHTINIADYLIELMSWAIVENTLSPSHYVYYTGLK